MQMQQSKPTGRRRLKDEGKGFLMTISIRVTALLAAAMLISPAFVAAQAPSDGPPSYRPGLGDLMTTTVQPRHIKLAFAGREKNWTYAAYELHELDEAFDRLSIQWPIWQKVRIVELVETIVRQPLYDLGQAIKEKNEAKYKVAYSQLTDACNACHEAARRSFVVIQEPKDNMFPDQDFRARP
jgi:hypothetical protein